MSRYLVVANQTLGGAELDQRITDRIEGSHGQFYVLVPMTEPENEADTWVPADPTFGMDRMAVATDADALDVARKRSEHRLRQMLERIRSAGGEAEGEVGPTDPFKAVQQVWERETFDEIIVSTLPAGISRWVKMDLPSRLSRWASVPVTVVEAES